MTPVVILSILLAIMAVLLLIACCFGMHHSDKSEKYQWESRHFKGMYESTESALKSTRHHFEKLHDRTKKAEERNTWLVRQLVDNPHRLRELVADIEIEMKNEDNA